MKWCVFVDFNDGNELALTRARDPDVSLIVCLSASSTIEKKLRKLGKRVILLRSGESFCEEVEGVVFVGYYGEFGENDSEFRRLSRSWYSQHNGKKIVLVLYGPPYGCKLDNVKGKGPCGNKDYRRFIDRVGAKVVVCAEPRERVGKSVKVGGTWVMVPSREGSVVELK